jgi:peptidoglycan-associated lipoprotein
MIRSIFPIAALLFLLAVSVTAQPLNESTPEANRKFAIELFETKDYYNARIKLERAYDDFKTNDLAWMMAMAEYKMRNYRNAERWFTRIGRRDKTGEFPEAQLWKARMMKMNGKYEEAIGEFNDIIKSDADPFIKRQAQAELSGAVLAVESPESKRLQFNNAGKELNKPGSEAAVFVAPSGEEMYYATFDMEETQELGEDKEPTLSRAHKAAWAKEKWSPQGPLSEVINREDYHTGSISISPDGERMYFTRVLMRRDSLAESRIFLSNRQANAWSPAYEVKGVNGEWMALFPCIGELFGNEVMYFVADIPGGHGGLDIYYSRKIDDQTFADPVNLGTVINGPGDEITPFYRDGRLYFSSTTHAGFGGYDIFQSDWDGSTWSTPQNMGKGFNTSVDDYSFTVEASGHKGALLSNRPEGKSLDSRTCCDDIYTFTIAPIEVELITTVKEGEKNRELRGVRVQIIDMTGDKMGETKEVFTGAKGAATAIIVPEKAYRLIATADGFFPDTLDFHTQGIKDNITLQKTLTIMPRPRDPEYEIYTSEEPIRLNSIYYDYDDDKILADAEPQLQLLVDLLNQYGDMVIELSSHTDARGNDDYNQRLSQRRAQSAKNWIVAKGIPEARIQAVGYGETQILNHCQNNVDCSDEDHRFNRRTEFRIISGPTTIQIEKKRLKGESGLVTPPKKRFVAPSGVGDSVPSDPGMSLAVPQEGSRTRSLIRWEEDAVDFGTLRRGEEREKTFYFTNTSDTPVTIELCNACDCMTLDWTALPVAPGARGKVEARFDSTKKEPGEVVNDYINVILANKHPGTEHPVIYELNYRARIVE